jgi:hypothetical protein
MPTLRWNFPLARRLLAFADRVGSAWRERHRHPVNYGLHLLGIPAAFLSLPLLLVLPWAWCLGLFAGGYFVQWVGHQVEGNDVGELIPVKRLLGLPVVAVAPRPAPGSPG